LIFSISRHKSSIGAKVKKRKKGKEEKEEKGKKGKERKKKNLREREIHPNNLIYTIDIMIYILAKEMIVISIYKIIYRRINCWWWLWGQVAAI
jgi:hypothetical protein